MDRAELIRQEARDAELRAEAYADKAKVTGDPADIRFSDYEAMAARILHSLANVEDKAAA
jgi:hypothetical protein